MPLYRQVQQLLENRIENGQLRPGDRLPAETELARELQVNRLTVRQAISELARAGQLLVRQGLGTFVAEPAAQFTVTLGPERTMAVMEQAVATLQEEGRTSEERLLSTEIAESDQAREHLGARRGRLRRVDTQLLVDQQAWAINTYWFGDARFRGIGKLLGAGDVFRICCDHYAVDLHYAWRSFAAAAASPRDAELLDIAVGSPVLLREGVNVNTEGKPVIYVSRRLRSDRMRFIVRYDTDTSRR